MLQTICIGTGGLVRCGVCYRLLACSCTCTVVVYHGNHRSVKAEKFAMPVTDAAIV